MARKGMDIEELNKFMGRCAEMFRVRYIKPTIHAGSRLVTAVEVATTETSVEFNITNHPDENFNLNTAVNDYLDKIEKGEIK